MKKGICRGCDSLVKKLQYQAWEKDGVTKRPEPIRVLKNYCLHFSLHISDSGGGSYIDRILDLDDGTPRSQLVCPYYTSGGVS